MTIVSILLLILTVNPTLIAIGQEETNEEETAVEEEATEETSEAESMSEEETSETEMTEEIAEEEMTEETMEEETMMMTQVQSPRKQMDEGVEAEDVVCKEGLELIIKASTGSAACVKPSSVEILLDRGWGSLA